jgi:hypothetical protein
LAIRLNHPDAWCLLSITLGCQSYTEAQVIAIMQNPTRGDRTYQLAAQLAAAKLNVDCNLTDSSCVASAIAAADAWLCLHPVGSNVTANSKVWKDITATYNTLADYQRLLARRVDPSRAGLLTSKASLLIAIAVARSSAISLIPPQSSRL